MKNLTIVYPFKGISNQDQSVAMIKQQIDRLPLFNECCIETTESPYYQEGDTLTDLHNNLVYRFNKYGHNILVNLFRAYYYDGGRPKILISDTRINQNIWDYPVEIKPSNTADLLYYYNLQPMQLISVKSNTTNGFWWYYYGNLKYFTSKIFLTKCIDESNGDVGYSPIVTGALTSNTNVRKCYVYTTDTDSVDVTSYSVTNSGFSPAYVLRQLRVGSLLYPDVYIISGGYAPIDQDIVVIDNNAYAHLIGDMYIKIN